MAKVMKPDLKQGAVFIYEYRNGKMHLTQKILMTERSFGMRLVLSSLTLFSSNLFPAYRSTPII